VILADSPFSAGVDVRGGAPGTIETDLLRAENSVGKIDAVFLSGGSAFGLSVQAGVVSFLEEKGRGFPTRSAKVPIVCGAILYDLALGDSKIRPDARAGYEAAKTATPASVPEGNVGAGAGATVGKMLGIENAMKAGIGSWAVSVPGGLKVGALVALNCVGDVVDPSNGRIIAGARKRDGSGFANAISRLERGYQPGTPFRENTVLAVVATNADLDKAECTKVAQMAQDAIARAINPSHTPWDGDTVFAVATGKWARRGASTPQVDVGVVGALAAHALATAILRAAREAETWGSYPAAKDFPARKN